MSSPISSYWKSSARKHIHQLRTPQRVRRYTSKHKQLGLAICKVCEYITATPTKPGIVCKCCKHTYSRSIRDNTNKSRHHTIIINKQTTGKTK